MPPPKQNNNIQRNPRNKTKKPEHRKQLNKLHLLGPLVRNHFDLPRSRAWTRSPVDWEQNEHPFSVDVGIALNEKAGNVIGLEMKVIEGEMKDT